MESANYKVMFESLLPQLVRLALKSGLKPRLEDVIAWYHVDTASDSLEVFVTKEKDGEQRMVVPTSAIEMIIYGTQPANLAELDAAEAEKREKEEAEARARMDAMMYEAKRQAYHNPMQRTAGLGGNILIP